MEKVDLIDTAEFAQEPTRENITKPKGCEGCNNWVDGVCRILLYPSVQHSRINGCAHRTHNRAVAKEDSKLLNPLKASKRSQQVKV
jgi:hypothetical protein